MFSPSSSSKRTDVLLARERDRGDSRDVGLVAPGDVAASELEICKCVEN
jgi:hypothetical protein